MNKPTNRKVLPRANRVRALCGSVVAAIAIAGASSSALAQQAREPAKKNIKPASADSRSTAIRTLDAINIEGEIAVPQVLFITARDYRRFRDGLDMNFRMKAVDVARSLDLPTHLRVVAKKKEEGQ